nr:ash family protein [Buttiauxella agrestis]
MVSLVRQPYGWPVSVVSGISTLISVTAPGAWKLWR